MNENNREMCIRDRAYADTLKAVREAGVPVIADIKRGDIAKTAEMYACLLYTSRCV